MYIDRSILCYIIADFAGKSTKYFMPVPAHNRCYEQFI